MNFQEGTVVTTQINHPPQTLSGVVIASKQVTSEPQMGETEARTFEVFKVMFQNESKNVGTYIWCSEARSFGSLHGTTPVAESAELIYAGEKHNLDCPIEVRKA